MKKLINSLVDKSLLVNLVSFLLIVIGLISMLTLKKESFPNVDFDFIFIRTNYPGASAEDVEKLVTIELERQLKEVEGVEELNGMSGEGFSVITLKVDSSYKVDDVLTDVRSAVDSTDNLPVDVDTPIVKKATNKQRPIMNYALSSNTVDEWTLREAAKKLRDRLEKIDGVARVNMDGYREEIIDVAVDIRKLHGSELTLGEIAQAIGDRNVNISAGNIKNAKTETFVRTFKELTEAHELENVVIRSNNSGESILIKDVATVKRSLKDLAKEEKAYGKPAIFLDIVSKESADILKTTDKVKKEIELFFKDPMLKEVAFEESFDFSFYVKRRINILSSNALQGIVLVFLSLYLFMNFRMSVLVAFGAPFAMISSFIFMEMAGITINMISLFGLIMVMGMLVDDAIIVGEQFYQYLENGMNPNQAAKKAASETFLPVMASVFTTIIAYSSLFFMGGIMGKFMWPVPAVVIICLLMSLIECYFSMPNHLAHFIKFDPNKHGEKKWFLAMLSYYRKMITKVLAYPKTTILIFTLMFISSIFVLKTLRFELFPSDDATKIYVNLKAPVGTSLGITRAAVDEVSKIVLDKLKPEEKDFIRSSAGWQMARTGFTRVGSHYGNVGIDLTMQDLRKRTTSEILDEIVTEAKKVVPHMEVSSERLTNGPPRGKPVTVELSGDSLDELLGVAKSVAKHLNTIPGALGVDIDFEEGKKQLLVDINEDEARRLGLSNVQIGLEIRRAFEGAIASEIRRTDEDVDVVVRLDEKSRSSVETLRQLHVLNSQGKRIHISRVANIKEVPGAFVIRRLDRRRGIAITSDVDLKKTTSFQLNEKIKPFLDELVLKYPSISYELTGENKDSNESVQRLGKSFFISIATMFVILVMMFSSLAQPLIIMSAIPMGIIGVIYTFKIMGLPIGFMALMGVIGLVGLVVNDSIVLVDAINRKLTGKTENYLTTIIDACVSRLRPVLLTTITTMVGLLPLAHSKGGDPFLKPMAISFAYGIGFATSLTLIFVPSLYLIYYRCLQWWKKKFSQPGLVGE